MAGKNSEKIKLYLVIGLSMIFVISFYFRFIQTKAEKVETGYSPEIPPARLNMPRLDPSLLEEDQRPKPEVRDEWQTVMRDIFSPVLSLSRPSKQGRSQQPGSTISKPLPSFKLNGTIVGRERSIAIIDNRFFRLGDRIGEYRVANIGEKNVLLESGNGKILLEILKNE